MVRVGDLDAALSFYCNKLGLQEIRRIDNKAGRFTLFPGSRDAARGGDDRTPWSTSTTGMRRIFRGRNFAISPINRGYPAAATVDG
jgi:lactoylglutathione lyase